MFLSLHHIKTQED